ncbi:MAG TPA: ribosome silencing factor [Chitinophagaceae bacterium]|nr:ribosome silencing factor [Chitinophagaceae bacterium]
MEQLSMLVNRKPNKSVRLAKNSKIIKAIIQAIQEKKGEKIISLDLRKIQEAVADFFIVCEAGSTTQIRAIADFIESEVKEKCGEAPYMHEGRQVLQWVIIDYINVVVHIMLPDSRRFYKLEEMWSDAVMEEHEG